MQRKNWLKKINLELLASPSFEEEMNLIDLPPLTKRQRVHYLPKKTLEQCRVRKKMAKELGIEPMGGGNSYERCTNFGIRQNKRSGMEAQEDSCKAMGNRNGKSPEVVITRKRRLERRIGQ